MPLRSLLRYRNPDSTADINSRSKSLIQKGIFTGGDITPVPGQLAVSVGIFAAVGSDGMVTVLEGSPEQLTVIAGQTQRVIGRFIYNNNAAPTLNLEVLAEATFLADPDVAKLITFASIALGPTDTEVADEDIDQTVSDRIDPVARNVIRGKVDTSASLPTELSTDTKKNRQGDVYYVQDENVFYYWDEGDLDWYKVVDQDTIDTLDDHINNLDPTFRHLSTDQEAALDSPASGTSLSAANPIVDSLLKAVQKTETEFIGLSSVYQISLSGSFYIGKGTADTAKLFFALARKKSGGDDNYTFRSQQQLIGSDNAPITILGIYPEGTGTPVAAPTPSVPGAGSLLNPSTDADSLGFITNPVIRFNFEHTNDDGYTGDLTVLAAQERNLGDLTPADLVHPTIFYPSADFVASTTGQFTAIANSNNTVQQALNALDTALATEIANRIAGDVLSSAVLLTSDNITGSGTTGPWEGIQEFQKNFQDFGSSLIGSTGDALIPRIDIPSRSTSGAFTLIWRSRQSAGQRALRLYTQDQGEMIFTVNAEFNGTLWNKDTNGIEATRLDMTNTTWRVQHQISGTNSWADAAWNETLSAVSNGTLTVDTDVVAGSDITATGDVSGTNVSAANIVSGDGVNATNDISSTSGDIIATSGDIIGNTVISGLDGSSYFQNSVNFNSAYFSGTGLSGTSMVDRLYSNNMIKAWANVSVAPRQDGDLAGDGPFLGICDAFGFSNIALPNEDVLRFTFPYSWTTRSVPYTTPGTGSRSNDTLYGYNVIAFMNRLENDSNGRNDQGETKYVVLRTRTASYFELTRSSGSSGTSAFTPWRTAMDEFSGTQVFYISVIVLGAR